MKREEKLIKQFKDLCELFLDSETNEERHRLADLLEDQAYRLKAYYREQMEEFGV